MSIATAVAGLSPIAARIRERSIERWGVEKAVEIVGRTPQLESLLSKAQKFSAFREPVLILGETGVGKELLAQALYLLSDRLAKRFVPVDCPQQVGDHIVSQLFGHKKGSFTGAKSDRKGAFETAAGGVIFLDEIGDLPLKAQRMLLRALATGEVQPLGSDTGRPSDVRVVAATNRPLNRLVAEKEFRKDLLYRLRFFELEIPPLRQRGDDWRLLLEHFLDERQRLYGEAKRFSPTALSLLEAYSWPGNVRELIGLVNLGYALADGELIEPRDFADRLEKRDAGVDRALDDVFVRLCKGQTDYWTSVQEPFLDRELNRREVQRLIARGLSLSRGSYRRLLDLWHIEESRYQKFMDFLRHHRLKPEAFR